MHFLPDRARDSLAYMGHCVEREVAESQKHTGIETEGARQAHFIKWCQLYGIEDPCGPERGRERLVAIYIKYVILGVNYNNKTMIRSETAAGYAKAVNTLFELRGFPHPANFKVADNMSAVIIHNLEREENIARQRNSLDNEIFAQLQQMAAKTSTDSVEQVVFNMVAFGRITGPRAGEYSQKTLDKVEVHKYPSGTTVVKAFIKSDFEFFDRRGRLITDLSEDSMDQVNMMSVTWRIQKNRRNGQKLQLAADHANPAICPVRNALRVVLRAIKLNQAEENPLAIFVDGKGKTRYLTAGKIAEVLRKAVKLAKPDIDADDLKKYSAHSIRVWACVLLSEAGKSPDFIKSRLRWLGESYRMYLQDTKVMNAQHLEALEESSAAVMAILQANLEQLHHITHWELVLRLLP